MGKEVLKSHEFEITAMLCTSNQEGPISFTFKDWKFTRMASGDYIWYPRNELHKSNHGKSKEEIEHLVDKLKDYRIFSKNLDRKSKGEMLSGNWIQE